MAKAKQTVPNKEEAATVAQPKTNHTEKIKVLLCILIGYME